MVHVLLGCVATTVRIVTGAPEIGNDQPVRVTVVAAAEPEPPQETPQEIIEEITPDWEQQAEPPMVAPELEPLEAPPLEPVEELEPLAELEPSEPAPPLEAPSLLEVAEPAKPQATEEPLPAEAEPEVLVDGSTESPTEKQTEKSLPTETPDPPPLPSTYADRFVKDRDALVEQRGGSAQTERAVRAALGWLAATQSKNGGWDASQFGAGPPVWFWIRTDAALAGKLIWA